MNDETDTSEARSAAAADRVRSLVELGAVADAIREGEEAAAALSGRDRALVLGALGFAYATAGHDRDFLRAAVEASELFQAAGDAAGSGDALAGIANALRMAGDNAAAIEILERVEGTARQASDSLRVARALRNIGVASSQLGRHQHALACLQEALDLMQQAGYADELLTTRLSLLNAHNRQLALDAEGRAIDPAQAERLLEAWRELADELAAAGRVRIELMARGNHAITLQPLSRWREAIAELEPLLPRYLAHGMKPNAALTHVELGRCHARLGAHEAARHHYTRSIEMLGGGSPHHDLIEAWNGLSDAHERLGDPAAALAALREARRLEAKRSDEAARQALAQRELRIELARLTSRWAREATLDPLTGLANRRALEHWLATHWPEAERGQPVQLLLLDLDHFKRVNDDFGHDTGDAVLRETAGLLRSHCRSADLAVRYGGEEFLLAMAGADRPAAETVAERLRAAIAAHDWPRVADRLAVTASVGLADAAEVLDAAALLTLADRRLYAAKYGGRNRVVVRD